MIPNYRVLPLGILVLMLNNMGLLTVYNWLSYAVIKIFFEFCFFLPLDRRANIRGNGLAE